MGARDDDSEADEDEKPAHLVNLDAFYIDKYEMTTERYRTFLNETRREKPPFWTDTIPVNHRSKPVVAVTWEDASAYCTWAQKRLPTEAEWEKAARGTDGRLYTWGNEAPTAQHANFGKRGFDDYGVLTTVGSKQAGVSPYGAHDMAGNVYEWVADWYAEDYYKNRLRENPKGPETGEYKLIRGGAWTWRGPWVLRSSNRFNRDPASSKPDVGFRCAKDASSDAN